MKKTNKKIYSDDLTWAVLIKGEKFATPNGFLMNTHYDRNAAHDYKYTGSARGEEIRILTFITKRKAQDWCNFAMESWKFSGDKKSKARPVRIRVSIEVIR